MASKSKRRRRVFRASCILAALIIAGSSFAWFTSKDEVTNRLTASNDYGVSIVESFIPPKNMIPGQEVNKDVYAVNTGNIGAFVKETVSGVLNYTYEKKVADAPDTVTADPEKSKWEYVELNEGVVRAIDGATAHEAGGYLAYTTAKVVGSKTYKVGNDEYTLGKTATVAKIDGTGDDKNFYPLTKVGEDTPAYYVEGSDPANDATIYTIATTTATADSNKLKVTNNMVPAAGGIVNSATITDANESVIAEGATDPVNNPGQVAETRWTPSVTGVYIFRRGITNAAADWKETMPANATADEIAANDAKAPKYTYAGYYFVKGEGDTPDKYYKIVIGDDEFRAEEESIETDGSGTAKYVFDISVDQDELGANVTVDKATGKINGDVPVQYVINKKVVNAVPTLTYHAEDADKHVAYLEATYLDSDGASVSLQQKEAALNTAKTNEKNAYDAYLEALSTAATDENNYEKALGDYNTAKSRYDQLKADYAYASALETATNKIYEDAVTRANAEIALENAESEMNKAFNKLMNEVFRLNNTDHSATDKFGDIYNLDADPKDLQDDGCDISFSSIFGTNERTLSTIPANSSDSGAPTSGTLDYIIKYGSWGTTQNQYLLPTVENYRTSMYDKWVEIKTQTGKLETAMKAFYEGADALNPERQDGKSDPAEAERLKENVLTEKAELDKLIKEYKKLYTDFKKALDTMPANVTADIGDDILTFLANGENQLTGKMDAWVARLTGLENAIKRTTDSDPGLESLIAAYKTAWEAYQNERNNGVVDAEKRWAQAVNDYNKAVNQAQKDYYKAIYTNQITPDEAGNFSKNDYEGLTYPGAADVPAEYKIDGYVDNTGDAYTSANKRVVRYLTNNNNPIVEEYASEKDRNGTPNYGKPAFGSDFVNDNGVLTSEGEDLWQKIGGTRINDNTANPVNTVLTVKGANSAEVTEAKYTDNTNAAPTVGNVSATYPYIPNTYTPKNEITAESTYAKAKNGNAIAGDETAAASASFLEINPKTKTNGTASDNLHDLKEAMDTAKGNLGEATDTSKPYGKYLASQKDLSDKEADHTAKNNALTNAQAAYDNGAQNEDSFIKFKIYLDDKDEDLEWTSYLYDGESTEGPKHEAEFYYDYILDPGATSAKLIDAVELSPDTKSKDYKELTFDLNVKLDSAQITYSDNQDTITDEAVKANDAFTLKLGDPITEADGKLTWGERSDNTEHIYFFVNERVEPTPLDASVTLPLGSATGTTEKTFNYKFASGGKTYYGEKKSGNFYEVDDADTPTYVVETPVVVQDVTPATMYLLGTNKVKDSDFVATDETFAVSGINDGNAVTYAYKIKVGNQWYIGTDKNTGTKYYKYTPETSEGAGDAAVSATDPLTLTV